MSLARLCPPTAAQAADFLVLGSSLQSLAAPEACGKQRCCWDASMFARIVRMMAGSLVHVDLGKLAKFFFLPAEHLSTKTFLSFNSLASWGCSLSCLHSASRDSGFVCTSWSSILRNSDAACIPNYWSETQCERAWSPVPSQGVRHGLLSWQLMGFSQL